jgi:hypothetical protein
MDDVLAPKLMTVRQPSEQYDSKCSGILDFQPSFNTVDLQTTRTNRIFACSKLENGLRRGFIGSDVGPVERGLPTVFRAVKAPQWGTVRSLSCKR